MKRLTISMSDALFDKLDQVENKSLFIRKLIEGELRKGITYSSDATYESLAGDIEDLHHEIRSLSSRLASIENQIANVKTTPSLTNDKFESDQAVSYQIPSLPSLENEVETPIIQTTAVDSYSMADGIDVVADKDQGSVSANISDIHVSLYAQDNDKVLPVHSDEMHNMPFRSVVNVGVPKESVCPITETPVNSMAITPGMADQPQEFFSVQANDPSTPSFIMPELSDVATAAPVPSNVASSEPSFPSSPSFVMPDLSDIATPVPVPSNVASSEPSFPSSPSFVMPDLSDVATPVPVPSNVASSEPSFPSSPLFVMPELSDGAGHSNVSPFEAPPAMPIPTSGNDMQMPPFAAADPSAPGIQIQPVPPLGTGVVQKPVQINDSFKVSSSSMPMNERLQGNILMYLPHGARIKRSIIKGLVSKKFSAEEIDAEINLMVSVHSLQLEMEDGVEYLLRP